MSLLPEDHIRHFMNIKKDFDRFFQDIVHAFDEKFTFGHQINIHETDDEVFVICEIPGIEKKEDVDLHIDYNHLVIRSTMNRKEELRSKEAYRSKRYSSHFHRTIPLPHPVYEDRIKANYKNGVLEVRMPKKRNRNKKKIDINFK